MFVSVSTPVLFNACVSCNVFMHYCVMCYMSLFLHVFSFRSTHMDGCRGRVWFSLLLLFWWGSMSLWCPWMIGEISGDVSVELSVESVMLLWSARHDESVLGVSSRQWVPGMISRHPWVWRFRELVSPRQIFELFLIYCHFWCNVSVVQLFWG